MREAEPVEILENRRLVVGMRALAVVILNAQQDTAVAIVCRRPHLEGVDDVAEVQIAGGRRRKAGNHEPLEDNLPPRKVAVEPFNPRRATTGREIRRIDHATLALFVISAV